MSAIVWNALKLGSAVLGAMLLVSNNALAAETSAAQLAQNQKSAATTDSIKESQKTVDQATPAEKTSVVANKIGAKETVVAQNTTAQPAASQLQQANPYGIDGATDPSIGQFTTANPVPATTSTPAVSPAPATTNTTAGAPAPVAQSVPTQPVPAATQEKQINPYSSVDGTSDPTVGQVTNVSQFSDVRPGDWAYEALRELVERYGCIAGYPNGTYRGNRALSRYEFAAGLRACLNQVEKLIAASTADFATKEDLERIRRLTNEFQAELATLGTRVDKLEGRVGFLETHQFSTTTKLNGEVIAAVVTFGALDGKFQAVGSRASTANRARLNSNTTLSDRVRLNFDTSFTGKDRLRTRLEANNTASLSTVTNTNESRVSFDNQINNTVLLGRLQYRFPATDSTTVFLDVTGGEFFDNFNTNNPYLESAATGALSRYGRFSPIYRLSNTGSSVGATTGGIVGSNTGAGATVIQKFGNNLSIGAGYLARRASEPGQPSLGLFDGTYSALGQINFQATQAFNVGLTYAHSYYAGNVAATELAVSGATGSAFANNPFGGTGIRTSSNAYGVEASFKLSQYVNISGWGGLTYATAEERAATANVPKHARANYYYYGAALAFPDLGKKGNLAAIIFGQPPKVTRNDFGRGTTQLRRRDRDNTYHIEALYRYRINDNIDITPGGFVVLNPEGYTRNSTEYVGVLRTTFRF